jgi:hypothetical protein
MSRGSGIGAALGGKSRLARRSRMAVVTFAAMCALLAVLPAWAEAHGPVAPIATSYLARIASLPGGLAAKVIDGDQRLWLRVPARETVVVLDYRGAPYLRFSRAGVAVNHNSPMYYLNQTPAEIPPSNLGPHTPPKWSSASAAHTYSWHDGRLHALATVAIAPGMAYVGRWSIPVRVNGRPSLIAGALWHADDPSLVWFWPIVVLVLSMLAAIRVNRPVLNLRLARLLSAGALGGISIAAAGTELHGRPAVSVLQAITLAVVWGFVVWVSRRLLLGRTGYFTWFAIAFVAIWEGAKLIPTLVNGFVLAATPAFLIRAACVVCLACGIGLLVVASTLIGEPDPDEAAESDEYDDEMSWESLA